MQNKLNQRTVKNLAIADKPYEIVDKDLKGFLLRIQPSGIMTYYYSYRDEVGKRQRYQIGRHGALTVTQARDIAERCAAKIKSGIDIQAEKKQRKSLYQQKIANTLGVFIEKRYKPWTEVSRKIGTTTIKRVIADFGHWFHLPLEEITISRLEQWVVEQRKSGKMPSTINRDITRLRALLSKAVEWENIEEHPLRKWKPLKLDMAAKVRYLTVEEEIRLRNALKDRERNKRELRQRGNQWREIHQHKLLPDFEQQAFTDHLMPMVLLSLNTGLRRGEVFKLQWKDIYFEESILTVVGGNTKSSKTLHIPLNQEAKLVLQDWYQQTKPSSNENLVFPGKDGKPYSDVKKPWNRLLELADIKHFRWHDMRHHFASKLVMKGVDLNTVRELLGHADLAMTLRYAHLAPEHKASAVAKLLEPT